MNEIVRIYCWERSREDSDIIYTLSIVIIAVLFTFQTTYGQIRCGVEDHHVKYEPKTSIITKSNHEFEIPIVFHVFTLNGEIPISELRIREQIEILNDEYSSSRHPNAFYDAVKDNIGTPRISFCLADKDENGDQTSGIIHYSSDDETLGNRDNVVDNRRKIKHTSIGGANAWNPLKYLNVWVGPRNDVLGDSSFPDAVGTDEDGIVINTSYIGYTSISDRFGLGRTLVHEMGHYLGLRHPWTNDDLCTDNDFIDDTPIQNGAYFGCPVPPQVTCGSIDYIYNFMQFHDDECLAFFTKGQVDLMHSVLENERKDLVRAPSEKVAPFGIDQVQVIQTANSLIIKTEEFLSIDVHISLFSINGIRLQDEKFTSQTLKRLDVSGLTSGIYLLLIETEDDYETRKIFIY